MTVRLPIQLICEGMEHAVPVRDDDRRDRLNAHGKRRRIEHKVLRRHVHRSARLEVEATPGLRAGCVVVCDRARQDCANRDERDAQGVQTLPGPPSRPRIELRGPSPPLQEPEDAGREGPEHRDQTEDVTRKLVRARRVRQAADDEGQEQEEQIAHGDPGREVEPRVRPPRQEGEEDETGNQERAVEQERGRREPSADKQGQDEVKERHREKKSVERPRPARRSRQFRLSRFHTRASRRATWRRGSSR